jgi:1-deoxy-D-xylulose-5-phosphate reductoisomerase
MRCRTLGILGSTGSIGCSTLKALRAFPERFRLRLLAARGKREALLEQACEFQPEWIVVQGENDAIWLEEHLRGGVTSVAWGEADLVRLIGELRLDLVVSAIVGAAGLLPTMAAIRSGARVALANKESMVIAGSHMRKAAKEHKSVILPVDSEHNAIHQCLRGERKGEVKRLILTASGGPFRTFKGDFSTITPEQALKHPTWVMGPKITIDSASLMNKGLEVIEAHHLFDFPSTRIAVVVHPQSIVHSLIETVDGSLKAQLSRNDMVHPILYALSHPERWPTPLETMDITEGLNLEFEKVDRQRFPCLTLAYEALAMGGTAPATLNASNEIAVEAFLAHQIGFMDIPKTISRALSRFAHRRAASIEDLFALDGEVRTNVRQWTGLRHA